MKGGRRMRRFTVLLLTGGMVLLWLVIGNIGGLGLSQGDPYEPNDTLREATPITLPFEAEGLSIFPPSDRDIFSFELEGVALVEVDVDADAIGSPLDSVLFLLDGNGEEIDESDDVDGLDHYLNEMLYPGRYYIVIRGYRSIGPYNLKIRLELFELSACVEGELRQKSSQMWRLGMLPPGTKLLVTLEGPEKADFDLYLYEVINENPLLTVIVGKGIGLTSREFVKYEVGGNEPKEYLAKVRAYEGEGAYKLCWYQSIP